MSRRAAAWMAWSLWALSLALTALSLWLLLLNLSHPEVPVYSFWAENILYSVGLSTVGAVIVPRIPPENPIGWLMKWDRSEGKDEVAFTEISGRRTLVTLFVTFGRRLALKISG